MNRFPLFELSVFAALFALLARRVQAVRHVVAAPLLFALLAAPAAADRQSVIDGLNRLVPDLGEVTVSETPLPGIYQVTHAGGVVYASDDGKYLLYGSLVDLEKQVDLTEVAMNGFRKTALAPLAQNRLVPFPARNARHEIIVFTDVTCGYCRKFHRNMRRMNDLGISVNYLLTPVLSDQAHTDAVNVWCARDRSAALTAAKLGQPLPNKQCENPIDSNLRLAKSLRVSGTPAIFLAGGSLLPGYVEPDKLLDMIEKEPGRAHEQ